MSVRAATARRSATSSGSSTVPERAPTTAGPSVDRRACPEAADVSALGAAEPVDGLPVEARSRCPVERTDLEVARMPSVRTPLCCDLRQVVSPAMRVAGSLDSAGRARAIGSEPRSSTHNHRDGVHSLRERSRARQPANGDSACSGLRSVRPTPSRRHRGRSQAHGAPQFAATRLPLGVAARPCPLDPRQYAGRSIGRERSFGSNSGSVVGSISGSWTPPNGEGSHPAPIRLSARGEPVGGDRVGRRAWFGVIGLVDVSTRDAPLDGR